MNTAILYLTDKNSDIIINQYEKLKNDLNSDYDIFLLYHKKEDKIADNIKNLNPFVFTDEIFKELGYRPLLNQMIPGNCHFPMFKFFKENNVYDYYWFIEDDVRFTGNWSLFFNEMKNEKHALIASYICDDLLSKNEYRWTEALLHPKKRIPIENRSSSFNPIYRLSNNAMVYLDEQFLDGWKGHNEVIIATLLNNAGFSMLDFGSVGKFVSEKYINRYYNPINKKGNIQCTHRWRPPYNDNEIILENMIYHPVKNF